MHKKDILFLISLPADLKAGMKISYTEYISILRSIERIELRESISQSDLAIADKFPLVIIVAHNNVSEESLILENGTLLPWTSIISYLPVSCTNTIDIGACKAKLGEMSVADAIKEHCPNIRRVLSPKKVTKVEGRLMLYREMLPSIDHDKDYYEVYSSKVAELQNRIIQLREGRKNKTETLQGTKLGTESSEDIATSVFAPKEVKATYKFPIQVFLYFDSEKGTLIAKAKAEGVDPDTMPRLIQEPLKNFYAGDMIDVGLTMLDKDKQPTQNIFVFYQEGAFTIPVKIAEEETKVSFEVKVTEQYLYEECWAQLSLINNDNDEKPCLKLEPFKIKIIVTKDWSQGCDNTARIHPGIEAHGNSKVGLQRFDARLAHMEELKVLRRKEILTDLLNLVDKGDWNPYKIGNDVKQMLLTILGQGETKLNEKESRLSENLWYLLENGRGDRIKITWQNLVGYFDEKNLFRLKGSPALNKDFFGNEEGYTNIDKGRDENNMPQRFYAILELLNAYCPT